MMKEQDTRNAHRIAAMETAIRKEMAAIVTRDEPRIISVDESDATTGGATAATATGPLLKVPATTMPPPKLSFLTKLSEFDSWKALWDAYLQTSGVMSIANEEARRNRARSLLTQAFDDDLRSWAMSQLWYSDAGVNGDVELVLERIRQKIEEEDDPFTVFATLMARPWQANADTADTFWVDIQTRVRYCGLKDAYHTDHVLRTLWASRYGDEEAKKEFALHPKWTAADLPQGEGPGTGETAPERRGRCRWHGQRGASVFVQEGRRQVRRRREQERRSWQKRRIGQQRRQCRQEVRSGWQRGQGRELPELRLRLPQGRSLSSAGAAVQSLWHDRPLR
jgi:hypothetical protein